MAAGNIVVYQQALEDINNGLIDLDSATMLVALVSHGYTPSPQSHSTFDTEISPYMVVAAGYAVGTLAGKSVARTTASHVAFDGTDLTISASVVMKAKYAVAYLDSNKRPVFYYDLETGSTTGVEATQIVMQWNANGIWRYSNPGA